MNNRLKFILLGMILANVNALAELPNFTDKENSPIYINGQDMGFEIPEEMNVEVDWADNDIEKNGSSTNTTAAWVENGGELFNYGSITGKGESIKSKSTLALLLAEVMENSFEKKDTLINLTNSSKFINNGNVTLNGFEHITTQNGIGILDIIDVGGSFANYEKNLITTENSYIENNKDIILDRDTYEHREILSVNLINGKNKLTYTESAVNMNGGKLINSKDGNIEIKGDFNPIYSKGKNDSSLEAVGVSLLAGGRKVNRTSSGIEAKNGAEIQNDGNIKLEGDIFKISNRLLDKGLTLDLIGSDISGTHKKTGVNVSKGTFNNTGIITIERDFKQAYATEDIQFGIVEIKLGHLVDLEVISHRFDDSLIDGGILNFKNMKEKSVGVSLSDSDFNNDNGTITVEVNTGDKIDVENSTAAIAVEAVNNSVVNFNGGVINLGGTNVYASNLKERSAMTFTGNTEINYLNKNSDKLKVNNTLFTNDSSSWHNIKGDLRINGDLTLKKGNNFLIGLREKDTSRSNEYGKLITEGHLTLNENIILDTKNILGMSQKELTKFSNQSLIVAGNGISGNGKFVSNSFLFDITTEKENEASKLTKDINNLEEIKLGSIKRKDFNQIVDNSSLGNLLENSYENFTSEQEKIYEQLASANNEKEFLQQLDEITGRKNVNTLSAQVYDITKDLTENYRELIRGNTKEGVYFKYLNSDSKFSNTAIAEGFERDSHGIIVNLNKNINEKLRTGLGFGYLKSNVDYSPSSSSNKIETWNVRGYLDRNIKNINLLTDFSFGYNNIDNNRISSGILNKGEAKVYSFAFNNSLYKEFSINEKLSVMPSLNLDMTYLLQDDYKENRGAEFGETANYFIRGGINISGVYNLFNNKNHKINLKTDLKYSYDFDEDVEAVEGKIYGFNDWIEYESRKIDRSSIAYNIGLDYEWKDSYSIGLKYSKELINDVDNEQIGIDIIYKF